MLLPFLHKKDTCYFEITMLQCTHRIQKCNNKSNTMHYITVT
ncbi:MAG: hypothetical protein K0R46_563 [Herbinix sp.]|jgi:hypothetical protein|nr:hypothetical protein [Herbinix sp.]